jgi:hypothetical protein
MSGVQTPSCHPRGASAWKHAWNPQDINLHEIPILGSSSPTKSSFDHHFKLILNVKFP